MHISGVISKCAQTSYAPRIMRPSLMRCNKVNPIVSKLSGISAALRDELHWLPIKKRIEFKIVLLARHCLVGAAPEYLMELCRPFSSAAGRQSLRSASKGDFIIPRFRLRTFGFRAFAISGPQLWNSLPLDVRQSRHTLMQFKMKLKTFLFQQF